MTGMRLHGWLIAASWGGLLCLAVCLVACGGDEELLQKRPKSESSTKSDRTSTTKKKRQTDTKTTGKEKEKEKDKKKSGEETEEEKRERCEEEKKEREEREAAEVENIVGEAEISVSKEKLKHGELDDIKDGKADTYVQYNTGLIGGNWMWIDFEFDQAYSISKVVVIFKDKEGSGKTYASRYRLLLHEDENPDDDPDPDSWDDVDGRDDDGDGGIDELHDFEPQKARHVALLLQRDGGRSLSETYAIADVRIYGRPIGDTDDQDAEDCE